MICSSCTNVASRQGYIRYLSLTAHTLRYCVSTLNTCLSGFLAYNNLLVGGFLAQAYGVAWDYWVPAICTSASFMVAVFLLPETLFSRHPDFLSNRTKERSYFDMLFNLKGNLIPGRDFHLSAFAHPFVMLKYPSISFPALYYFSGWMFVNTMPAVTIANTYNHVYHWKSGQIGLCLGTSLVIGSFLAEAVTGHVTDLVLYLDSKRNNGIRRPEARLYQTLIGAVFQPVGLMVYGFCIQNHKGWVASSAGLAIGKLYIVSLQSPFELMIVQVHSVCR